MRPTTGLLLGLILTGCDRAAPAPAETGSADGAGHPSRHAAVLPPDTAPMDTLRHPVAGVIARFGGEPRATRMLPLRPMTTDSEILFGDPAAEGEPFVIRIRELPGVIVPPHSHPVDEHLTVLQGTWYFGIGEEFDAAKLQALSAGSYAFVPAGTPMFAHSPEPAVVQVHGIGPFEIHWKHGMITLEDPGAESVFRFRTGQAVSTPRGAGRIRWGGASGTLIQYEIEAADGRLFTVQEHEVANP